MELVKISIGNRTYRVPLNSFLHILNGSESGDCEAAYMKHRLEKAGYARPSQGKQYWFGVGKDRKSYGSLSDVLVAAMIWIHDNAPDAHRRLADRRKTSRGYIAEEPSEIYASNRGDLGVHARRYVNGWYVDTNLSYAGVCRFLDDCFAATHLEKGRDWFFRRL